MNTTYAIPPLTADLVEQIIYAMENQNEIAVLDLAEGIVTFEEESGSGKTVHLPEWSSADGFDLMARFAARNRSPRLKAALAKGHGVFRAFKDVLDTDADLKQRWLSFKHHEMEKVVTSWCRKLKQREASDGEDLDMADALLEDFSVVFSDQEPEDAELLESLHRDGNGPLGSFQGASFVSVLSPDNTLVGMMVYRLERNAWHVVYYGIDASWRGLGLFRLMFERLVARAPKAGISHILFDSDAQSMGVGSMFDGVEGVRPVRMTLEIPAIQYLARRKPAGEEGSAYL